MQRQAGFVVKGVWSRQGKHGQPRRPTPTSRNSCGPGSAHLLRLALLLATISQDGHVLFSPFFGPALQPYLACARQ